MTPRIHDVQNVSNTVDMSANLDRHGSIYVRSLMVNTFGTFVQCMTWHCCAK